MKSKINDDEIDCRIENVEQAGAVVVAAELIGGSTSMLIESERRRDAVSNESDCISVFAKVWVFTSLASIDASLRALVDIRY